MMSTHWTWTLIAVVVLPVCGTIQGAESPDGATVEQIIETWKARQNRIRSLRFQCTEERVLHRKNNRVLRREHEIVVKGTRLRHERRGDEWNDNVDDVLSPHYIAVFDGERNTSFFDYESHTDAVHPVGFRSAKDLRMGVSSEANNHTVWPIFHTFCFDLPGFIPTDAASWRLSSREATIDGRRCLVLEEVRLTPQLQQYRVWVDPERDYCAVRLEMGPKNIGIAYAQLDIDHDRDSSGEWIPKRWTSLVHCQPGNQFVLEYTARFTVTDYELNPPVDDSLFQIDFPPGTEVMDESSGSPRSFIVRESGIRPVYDEERLRGARYSDLISTDPGKALMLRRRSLLSWGWLLVNAAALASIGWLLLRRR